MRHRSRFLSTGLMLEGGHITGYFIEEGSWGAKDALSELMTGSKKYGEDSNKSLTIGDGNHSLAIQDNWKTSEDSLTREAAQLDTLSVRSKTFMTRACIWANSSYNLLKNRQSGEELVKEAVELPSNRAEKTHMRNTCSRKASLFPLPSWWARELSSLKGASAQLVGVIF